MWELLIKQLLNDPTFFKNGGGYVLVLTFIFYIFNSIEKKIKNMINGKHKILEDKIDAHNESIEDKMKNIVHEELIVVKKEAEREYKHLLRNLKSINKLIGEAILSNNKKDIEKNVRKADEAIEDCLKIVE